MSLTTENMSAADIAAVTGNNNDGFGGGNGAWWIIILFLFAFCGWGNNNGGFGGYGGGYVSDNYTLVSDMGQLERKIDTVNGGLCDGFFSTAQLINGVNMQGATNTAALQNTLTQGFAGLNTALVTQGYEARGAVQGVGTQLSQCCCDVKSAIADVNYNNAMQANATQNAINTGFCQTNFNMAQQTTATQQAIDKVGDRIIDYLSTQENNRLRDEISQYRASANSQYIINEINKCPVPAYLTCNPNGALNYSIVSNGCGCNSCGA